MDASIWHVSKAPLTQRGSIQIEIIDPDETNAEANTLLRTVKLV